jgi:hypothetical protein
MSLRDKFFSCCQVVMAIPFILLMLASLFFAGTNVLILFTDKPGLVRPQ